MSLTWYLIITYLWSWWINKNLPGTFNTNKQYRQVLTPACIAYLSVSQVILQNAIFTFILWSEVYFPVYTLYFLRKIIVEVSSPCVPITILLFFARYKILATGMATQNKDYISQTPLQVDVAMWQSPGHVKGAEAIMQFHTIYDLELCPSPCIFLSFHWLEE